LNTRKPRLDKFEQPDFIARLRAGDETAYQEVVEELAVWFAVYTKRKFGINEEDAKDIVQDTVLTVYRKIKSYDPVKGKFIQKRQNMAKKPKQALKAFEAYLRHLYETSPHRPFTTEQIERILISFGTPKDLSKYRNEKLIPLMKEIHARQLAQAEANFRNPSQMHSLGELLDSTLIIKNMFISQLAQPLDMTPEEIEDHIENRRPTRSLREDQMQKLATLTDIAIEEIRRIAGETAKTAETKTLAAVESTPEPAPGKPPRPYPNPSGYSGVGIMREEKSSHYKK